MAHYLDLTDSDASGPDSPWANIGDALRLSDSVSQLVISW